MSVDSASAVASSPVAPPRLPRRRLLFLLLGGVALAQGTYTGLGRAGIEHRFIAADLHAVIMVLGFLGTLIALERAVALGAWWGWLGPASTAAATLVLPVAATAGGGLLLFGGLVVTATYLELLRRAGWQVHLVIMGLGAAAWVAAAALWLDGIGPIRITPLLAAFLVLTIVGERLELSRLTLPSQASRRRFLVAVAMFVAGAALAPFWRTSGLALGGLGLLGQAAWLARHDLARRTVRRPGLTRFIAVCLLAGYVWLAVSGGLWVAMGSGAGGHLLHDALVHSLFIGFVLSMVMGHAPIIVPAVLRTRYDFRPVAYLPLVMLHASVALRVGADLAGSMWWRELALHGNVLALTLFLIVTVRAVRRGHRAAKEAV